MKKTFLLIVTVLLLTTFETNAQSFTIGPMLGLSKTQSFDNDFGYQIPKLGDEMFYGLKSRLGLPLSPFTITAFLTYANYSKDFGENTLEANLLTIGFGGELNLIPGPINLYLAADILINSFGEITLKAPALSSKELRLSDGLERYGVGLGAGINLSIIPSFDIDASVKYNLNNILNKEDNEENFNSINVGISLLFKIL